MKRILYGLLFALLFSSVAACQPRVEYVTVESQEPAEVEQVVVTRLVMVTPDGAGPAIPGTMTPLIEERVITVTVSVPPLVLGSPEQPIRLLLAADVSSNIFAARTDLISEMLSEQLDMSVQVEQLENFEAVVDTLCEHPASTVAFLPAMGYVLANERCAAQVGATAQDFDLPWHMGMIVVRADSGIRTLEDLTGKRWAKSAQLSVARDLYFQAQLGVAGIEPGEIIAQDSDNSALLAVFNGEADFATATYWPPVLPYAEREWVYGEDAPELWRQLGITPERHARGYVVVIAAPEDGGYHIRDARASLFDVEPGIFSQTRIVGTSEPIPNESVVFGPEFPLALAGELRDHLLAFAASDACARSVCADDFYGWEGLAPVDDSAYDPLRLIQEYVLLSPEQLWATLD